MNILISKDINMSVLKGNEMKSNAIISKLSNIVLPGCNGIPLSKIIKDIKDEKSDYKLWNTSMMASYNIVLTMAPTILIVYYLAKTFGFSTILKDGLPIYIPQNIMHYLRSILDIGTLSGFIMIIAMIFTSSGIINSFYRAFNKNSDVPDRLDRIVLRIKSLFVFFALGFLFLISTLAITTAHSLILEKSSISNNINVFLLILRYVTVGILLMLSTAILYYYGNNKKEKFKLFTIGSFIFSLVYIILILVFEKIYQIKLEADTVKYGQISTLFMIFIWINIVCFFVLIGYNINKHVNEYRKIKEGCYWNNLITFGFLKIKSFLGNKLAKNQLAEKYVSKNKIEKALEIYINLNKLNSQEAKYHIGKCYFLLKKYDEAYKYFSSINEKENYYIESQLYLGRCLFELNEKEKAEQKYNECIENNQNNANFYLGELYYHIENYDKAIEYYKKLDSTSSDNNENKIACYKLGDCYHHGKGTFEDFQEALVLLEKSANEDYPKAQLELGKIYYDGNHCAKDLNKAEKWFEKAMNQEFINEDEKDKETMAIATYYWGKCCIEKKTYSDTSKSIKLFKISASMGNRDAMKELSNCYKNGIGVIKREKYAKYWENMAKTCC